MTKPFRELNTNSVSGAPYTLANSVIRSISHLKPERLFALGLRAKFKREQS